MTCDGPGATESDPAALQEGLELPAAAEVAELAEAGEETRVPANALAKVTQFLSG
jgi:hypothetical protein